MKRFMAIYIGSANAMKKSAWTRLDATERAEREAKGMTAWAEWMSVQGDKILDVGAPLGKTVRVSAEGIADTSNNITGYVVVEAESQYAAAQLFEQHPHFSIFPGDCVEIMELLPMPGTS